MLKFQYFIVQAVYCIT